MWNLTIGIIMILAGLSGKFVFFGTNSPYILVLVGVGMCIWGSVQLFGKG